MQLTIDAAKAKVIRHHQPDDPFFVGFTNMILEGKSFKGTVPVGNDGMFGMCDVCHLINACGDGEFSFGVLSDDHRHYKQLSLIPFRGMMDDTEFLDKASGTYYVQASYDKRPQRCAPHDYGK